MVVTWVETSRSRYRILKVFVTPTRGVACEAGVAGMSAGVIDALFSADAKGCPPNMGLCRGPGGLLEGMRGADVGSIFGGAAPLSASESGAGVYFGVTLWLSSA